MEQSALIAWLALGFLSLLGLAGIILPGIPGTILIFVGALIHKFMLPEVLSWWTIGLIGVGVVLSSVIDALGSLLGAKMGGASKWGLMGAIAGTLIGLLFLPWGLLLGPLCGAFLGEIGAARRSPGAALKSGLGAGLGLAISTLLRLLIALLLIGGILLDAFLL